MTILSDFLKKKEVAKLDPNFVKLRQIVVELEEVMTSDSLDDEEKYDLVFSTHKTVVQPFLKELGLRLEYYDPDTTYVEDAWAYINALQELMS